MTDSGTKPNTEPRAAVGLATKGRWSAPECPQEYVDEAVLQYINGRVYLSLGQIQIPPSLEPLESVEILPVARLVFSEASFHKILTMLNRAAGQIANPGADPEEE